jgi:hypothetical protein
MKSKLIKLSILIVVFYIANTAYAQVMRRIDVGKLQTKITDDGLQTWRFNDDYCSYKRGSYEFYDPLIPWPGGVLRCAGTLVGNRNWTDTLGNFWPYHVTGHCVRQSAIPNYRQFNIPEEGFTIRRYFRYPYPLIYVDGVLVSSTFPLEGDVVDPGRVWGTADVMVECHYRLSNGMDVYQRNLAWSQKEHDDYVVWDLTFVNTGNTDLDTVIELPGQTLDSLIIMKHYESLPNLGMYPWGTWAGTTVDHNTRLSYPQDDDSLRINYTSLSRKDGHEYDCYGHKCSVNWGGDPEFLDGTRWVGHVILFAPKNTSVPQTYPIVNITTSNDPAEPSMHSTIEDFYNVLYSMEGNLDDTLDHREPYRCMRKGIWGYNDTTGTENQRVYSMDSLYNVYDTTAMGAKTYYDQPQDRLGETRWQDGGFYPRSLPYYTFSVNPKFSIGPYNMEFGDTLRFTYAVVAGSIHRKTSYLLSEMWVDGNARNYGWVASMDSADIMNEYQARDVLAEIYSKIGAGRTLLYQGGGLNAIAKDYIVSTGKDSLFNNGMAAQRNFNMNYNIPASPAPPSVFEINSGVNAIYLKWRYDGGVPADVAGYKIYKAIGAIFYQKPAPDSVVGDWILLDSIANPLDSSYVDSYVPGGIDFYYAITAYNNQGIESGIYLTMMPDGSPVQAGINIEEHSFNGLEILTPSVFSKSLVVRYTLGRRLTVKLSMFNIAGQCVREFISEESQRAGEYTLELTPASLPPGIYFLHIKAGEYSDSKKCVLIK